MSKPIWVFSVQEGEREEDEPDEEHYDGDSVVVGEAIERETEAGENTTEREEREAVDVWTLGESKRKRWEATSQRLSKVIRK